MNHSKPYKQRILDFLETVGSAGADNTSIRQATGIPSHQQVYLLTQELTGRKQIAARRKGRTWIFYPRGAPSPDAFRGVWQIVSSPDFDQEYLEMEAKPFILVGGRRYTFDGEFHVGLIQGNFHGRLDGKRVLFSFEAQDELDPVHGAGTLALQDAELEFRLMFYLGDEYTFRCTRS